MGDDLLTDDVESAVAIVREYHERRLEEQARVDGAPAGSR